MKKLMREQAKKVETYLIEKVDLPPDTASKNRKNSQWKASNLARISGQFPPTHKSIAIRKLPGRAQARSKNHFFYYD